MISGGTSIFKGLDPVVFSIVISLGVIGWLMIFSVGYGSGYPDSIPGFLKTEAGRQAIFLVVSAILFLGILVIDWKFWRTFSNPIYIGSMVLLLLVALFGSEINGARSWFRIFGFSFQPSELAKFGTCLALSDYLATVKITSSIRQALIYAGLIIGIPIVLVLLQPDAGSALIFFSFVVVLYRNGLSPYFFIVGLFLVLALTLGIVVPLHAIFFGILLLANAITAYSMRSQLFWLVSFALVFVASVVIFTLDLQVEAIVANCLFFVSLIISYIREKTYDLPITMGALIITGILTAVGSNYTFHNMLKPHHMDRINVWLQPEKADPQGSAYNLFQSKVAIGSGGLTGQGFLEGSMTKLNYIPEQSTDFIFSSIGEEHGFLGSMIVIALFMVLLWRIIAIAEKQRSPFSRNYAYAVAGVLFVHVMINIGMTMGLFPVIGIPLPFISKGGSSLLGFTLMIGVLLKLDQHLKSV